MDRILIPCISRKKRIQKPAWGIPGADRRNPVAPCAQIDHLTLEIELTLHA